MTFARTLEDERDIINAGGNALVTSEHTHANNKGAKIAKKQQTKIGQKTAKKQQKNSKKTAKLTAKRKSIPFASDTGVDRDI